MNINSRFIQETTERMAEICNFTQASIPLPLIGFERRPVQHFSEEGFEALGAYNSKTHVIHLYPHSIERCALDLQIDVQTICNIVLAHEVAHLITHKGKGDYEYAKEWQKFEHALREDKEWAAQSLTFHVLVNSPEMLAAFKILSDEAPECYRTWSESRDARSFADDLYQRSDRMVSRECILLTPIDE